MTELEEILKSVKVEISKVWADREVSADTCLELAVLQSLDWAACRVLERIEVAIANFEKLKENDPQSAQHWLGASAALRELRVFVRDKLEYPVKEAKEAKR